MSLHFSNDSSGLILCGQRVNDAQYIPGRSLLRLPLFPGLRFTVPLRTFHWSWFRLRRRIQRVHHAVVVVINNVAQIFLERGIVDMLVMVSCHRPRLLSSARIRQLLQGEEMEMKFLRRLIESPFCRQISINVSSSAWKRPTRGLQTLHRR